MSTGFATIVAPEKATVLELLDLIAQQVAGCKRCGLCAGRTNTVPGSGNPHARVMLIGEAPGKNEDLKGQPFVGAAGKNLGEFLSFAGLNRDDVFIANILKCRPPSNRNPQPEEIELCTPYLRDQVRAISPQYLVTMGNFATQFILKTQKGITSLRGTPISVGKFTVFPVFHPAAAIYDRSKRAVLEQDFTRLGVLLGTVSSDESDPSSGAANL